MGRAVQRLDAVYLSTREREVTTDWDGKESEEVKF